MVALERGAAPECDALPRATPAFLSVVSASELLHGVHRARAASQRARREKFVEGVLRELTLLPVDLEVARTHARLWAELAERGESIGERDIWIAATALAHDLVLLTANRREFSRIQGLEVRTWPASAAPLT